MEKEGKYSQYIQKKKTRRTYSNPMNIIPLETWNVKNDLKLKNSLVTIRKSIEA